MRAAGQNRGADIPVCRNSKADRNVCPIRKSCEGRALAVVHAKKPPVAYDARNPLRQDLWRAGHAHAGALLVLALLVRRYVEGAALPKGWKWLVRRPAPTAATLLPAAFFLSVLSPGATGPNALSYLASVGGVVLALSVLGIGLVRPPATET